MSDFETKTPEKVSRIRVVCCKSVVLDGTRYRSGCVYSVDPAVGSDLLELDEFYLEGEKPPKKPKPAVKKGFRKSYVSQRDAYLKFREEAPADLIVRKSYQPQEAALRAARAEANKAPGVSKDYKSQNERLADERGEANKLPAPSKDYVPQSKDRS